jgi:hypothetical protein
MYNQDLVETVIADKFRIVRRIGGGSFGEIYLCVGPNGTEVPKTQTFFALSCYFFFVIYEVSYHVEKFPQMIIR